MGPSPLQLLRHAVHVAQTPLKWLIIEYRGGTRFVVNVVHDIPGRMDRERRRLTHRDALIHRQFAGLA